MAKPVRCATLPVWRVPPSRATRADWAPRIAQGKDILYKHAMEGFTGSKGVMPARGGSTTLTDDEVKAAVDYMADQSI
jgi:cytochrome c5